MFALKYILSASLTLSALIPAFAQTREELLDSANFYSGKEKYEDAERCLKQALRLEPANRQNALLLSNLGLVQTSLGKTQEALQSYEIGLTIAPSSTVLLTNRGGLLLQLQRMDDGLADLSKALEIDSTLSRPRTLRALALISLNRFPEAEYDLRSLLTSSAEDDALIALLAQCREAQGFRSEAEDLLTKAIGKSPDPQYYFDLTRMLILDESYEKAREIINDGIIAFPEDGRLYMLRGYIHRKRYRPTEAMADREIALRKGVDPLIVEAWIPKNHARKK